MKHAQVPIIHVVDPTVPEPAHATWSNCLIVDQEIVLSGVTAHPAHDPQGRLLSTEEQTKRIFDKIDSLITTAGADRYAIYKLVIYLTDINDKNSVADVRAAFFDGSYPCSTLVEVSGFAFPGLSVEIDVFARLGCDLRTAVSVAAPTDGEPALPLK